MNYNLFENQKFTKILTVVVFAVIIVFAFKETQSSVDKTNEEIKNLPSDVYVKEYKINKINITTDSVPIEINNDNEKNNVVVKVHARVDKTYKVKQDGNTLDLEFNKTSCSGLCLQEEKIIVSLPTSYNLDFNISGDNTKVDIATINMVKHSTINLKKGTINIKSLPNTYTITNIDKGKVKINDNNEDADKVLEIFGSEVDITIN